MNYYLDTEFINDPLTRRLELISIGIIAEDGRTYYAISNEFDLVFADNLNRLEKDRMGNLVITYWLRHNVLLPIFNKLDNANISVNYAKPHLDLGYISHFQYLLSKYGKSNKTISEDILNFCSAYPQLVNNVDRPIIVKDDKVQIYGWHCAHDYVLFCWLFGGKINVPKPLPAHFIDLVDLFDSKRSLVKGKLKDQPTYPKNLNEHNALADANWNKQLHTFLLNLPFLLTLPL